MAEFPTIKKRFEVEKLGREVVLTDLSMEYMHNIQTDASQDNAFNALSDASDMSEKEILSLGRVTAEHIYREIIKLSELGFDEDEGKGEGKKS